MICVYVKFVSVHGRAVTTFIMMVMMMMMIIIIIIIIKNTKEKTCTLIDVAIPADRNVVQKEAEKKLKYKCLLYRDTTNVEPEMYDCTSNNWSDWNSNKKLKEKFGNCTGKTFDRFTTKDSYTWNSTHNTESAAV